MSTPAAYTLLHPSPHPTPHPPPRPMREDDLDAVCAVERRVFDFPWNPGVFLSCLHEGCECRILERGDRIVGYGVMAAGAGECHLLNLCIHPDFRRRGHGRALLRCLLGIAVRRGAVRAILEVRADNPAAQNLYLSEGFNRISRRRNYYPSSDGREDAVVLARVL